MRSFFSKTLVLLALTVSMSSFAASITWTLNGVTFSDGGTASGSFAYDPATNQFSAISIATTTGSSVAGTTFSFVCQTPCVGVVPDPTGALFLTLVSTSNLTGTQAFALFFGPGLSLPGTVQITSGLNANCSNSTCAAPAGASRFVTAGTATGSTSAVPTLSQWSLILLAVLLVAVAAFGARSRRVTLP
jgi:hypothetical protein